MLTALPTATTNGSTDDHPGEVIVMTLEELTQQLASALADLDAVKQRAEGLKEAIRQHPDVLRGGPDRYQAGDATLTVSTNRRFNEDKALPMIPEEVLPIVTYPQTRVDRDKLAALLPDVFEAAQVESPFRVSIR